MFTYVYKCPKCRRAYKMKARQAPRCDCGTWTLYDETIDEVDHQEKLKYYWQNLKKAN